MTANEKRSLALRGKKKSPEHVEKVRMALTGRRLTAEHCAKLSAAHSGKPLSATHRAGLRLRPARNYFSDEERKAASERMSLLNAGRCGSRHPRWISDRSKLKRSVTCRSAAHYAWSKAVRRKFKHCVLEHTGKCLGRLEAHHIKSYEESPELRYDVRNGVTLCRAHHPRKQSEVKRLEPILTELVQRQGLA